MFMYRFFKFINVVFYLLNFIYIWFIDFFEEDKDYILSDILSDEELLEEMCIKLLLKWKRWIKDEEKVFKFEFNKNFKENSILRNVEIIFDFLFYYFV